MWDSAQSVLKVFRVVFPTQNNPGKYLQRYHTTKIEVSKVFSKFKKTHWMFCLSTSLICHSTVSQVVFNETPHQMSLESLLRVFWHFWRYVEYFSEFNESIGMYFETFWKLSDEFFEASKKSFLSLTTCGNFYLSLA